MHRQTRSALKVKENESDCPEEKKEASEKIHEVAKSKLIRASTKENSSDGIQAQPGKRALQYPKGLEQGLSHPEGNPGSSLGVLGGDWGTEALAVNSKGSFPSSTSGPLGDGSYLTPQKPRGEGKAAFGILEEWRKKPVDFAAVTIAESGIAQGSFTPGCKGNSPAALKFRRRATVGLRGSPENNSLIRYLAQQRSMRPREPFTQVRASPRTCSFSSPHPVTAPAAPKKWVYEQQNPAELLETVGIREVLETAHVFRADPITAGTGSDALPGGGRWKVGFGEELSMGMLDKSKSFVTPPRTGNIPFSDLSQSGSLRSILKKSPRKQLLESPEEFSHGSVARGGESVPNFSCAKISEASETENTGSLSFITPKKKKVTFGEDLSPEIFDETLPANTPLCRGASPAPALPQPHFQGDQECLEPLQEGPDAGEFSPVGKAEETDKNLIKTHPSTKKKCRGHSEEADCDPSGAVDTKDAEDATNPRKNKIRRRKNSTTSRPKKRKETKHTGKRRKKTVIRCLYGERELASKKPCLSPIPEIPEVFLSVSPPSSPKTDALFPEDAVSADPDSRNARKDVQEKAVVEGMRGKNIWAADVYPSPEDTDVAAPGSSSHGTFQVPEGDLERGSGTEQKFSKVVPDTKGDLDPSEYSQQGEKTAWEKEAKQSGSLLENEHLEGNLLLGLEFLEQEASGAHGGAQRVQCPQKVSASGSRARRSRRSSRYFSPIENLGITGIELPVSSYDVEEVLSVPKGPSQPFRRKSSSGGRVRRSMRLRKEAGSEGLGWIELPTEIPKQPPLAASAPKRRSASILRGSEDVQPRGQNLLPFAAPGKENEDSAPPNSAPPGPAPPNSAPLGPALPDSAPPNSAPPNSAPPDSVLPDSAPPNSAPPDSALPDSAPPNSVPPDSALPDSALPDSAPPDSAPPDSAPPDSALPDSALPDSALPDSALPDSAPPNSAPPGPAPSGPAPPGPAPPVPAPPDSTPPNSAPPGPAHPDNPCTRPRKKRRSCAATPRETPCAQTQQRRARNSVNRRDRNKQKDSEEA